MSKGTYFSKASARDFPFKAQVTRGSEKEGGEREEIGRLVRGHSNRDINFAQHRQKEGCWVMIRLFVCLFYFYIFFRLFIFPQARFIAAP